MDISHLPTKSTFVTVLAWVFIVLSGFSTLIGILQNVMIQFMFSAPDMQTAMESSKQTEGIPAIAEFMFSNIRWFFLLVLMASATLFISSVGLLKRKNWARILFIGIMVLGIIWNIGGFVLQITMLSTMSDMPSNAPPEFQTQFTAFSIIIVIFAGLMALGFSFLFGWIIKRLISRSIKQEFQVVP